MFHSVQVGAVVPDVSDSEGITEENEELVKLQRQDEKLGLVVTFLEQGLLPPEGSMARRLSLEKCWYVVYRIESFPSDNQTSETIVRLLIDHVICRHGVPEI